MACQSNFPYIFFSPSISEHAMDIFAALQGMAPAPAPATTTATTTATTPPPPEYWQWVKAGDVARVMAARHGQPEFVLCTWKHQGLDSYERAAGEGHGELLLALLQAAPADYELRLMMQHIICCALRLLVPLITKMADSVEGLQGMLGMITSPRIHRQIVASFSTVISMQAHTFLAAMAVGVVDWRLGPLLASRGIDLHGPTPPELPNALTAVLLGLLAKLYLVPKDERDALLQTVVSAEARCVVDYFASSCCAKRADGSLACCRCLHECQFSVPALMHHVHMPPPHFDTILQQVMADIKLPPALSITPLLIAAGCSHGTFPALLRHVNDLKAGSVRAAVTAVGRRKAGLPGDLWRRILDVGFRCPLLGADQRLLIECASRTDATAAVDARILLSAGHSALAPNKKGLLPLEKARSTGNAAMVQLLTDFVCRHTAGVCPCDVDATAMDGGSAKAGTKAGTVCTDLFAVVDQPDAPAHLGCAQMLLRCKADPDRVHPKRKTRAVDIAETNGHQKLCQLLETAQAARAAASAKPIAMPLVDVGGAPAVGNGGPTQHPVGGAPAFGNGGPAQHPVGGAPINPFAMPGVGSMVLGMMGNMMGGGMGGGVLGLVGNLMGGMGGGANRVLAVDTTDPSPTVHSEPAVGPTMGLGGLINMLTAVTGAGTATATATTTTTDGPLPAAPHANGNLDDDPTGGPLSAVQRVPVAPVPEVMDPTLLGMVLSGLAGGNHQPPATGPAPPAIMDPTGLLGMVMGGLTGGNHQPPATGPAPVHGLHSTMANIIQAGGLGAGQPGAEFGTAVVPATHRTRDNSILEGGLGSMIAMLNANTSAAVPQPQAEPQAEPQAQPQAEPQAQPQAVALPTMPTPIARSTPISQPLNDAGNDAGNSTDNTGGAVAIHASAEASADITRAAAPAIGQATKRKRASGPAHRTQPKSKRPGAKDAADSDTR
jgi:hypothetical protein